MPKKTSVGWENAILEVIEKHKGIANLKDIYAEVPLLINVSKAKDLEHNIRGYLRRLKTLKKQIKQIGLSTYAVVSFQPEENVFEDVQDKDYKKTFLEQLPEIKIHSYIEGMLVELGNFNGYETYTSDKNVVFNGKELAEIVSYLNIPNFSYSEVIGHVKQIDVIWFKNGFPVKTFDVENSTDFTKALLRAYQLRYYRTDFFMVSTESKKDIYQKRINYQPFTELKNYTEFKSYQEIYDLYKLSVEHNKKTSKNSIFK